MRPLPSTKTYRSSKWFPLVVGNMAVFVLCFLLFPSVVSASEARLITWDTLLHETQGNVSAISSSPTSHNDTANRQSDAFFSDARGVASHNTDRVPLETWTPSEHATSTIVLNQPIIIDGYVLPLAWEGIHVTEFLLVPWVGACIHMPTPAPNQIIHVSVTEGIVLQKQFEAVRLKGTLVNSPAEHDLFLVDGQRRVSVAYALQGAERSGSPAQVIAMSADDLPLLAKLQLWINDFFTESMQAIADNRTPKALIFALLVSFGYGALHTLGPGHGKSVVISYFVGSGGNLRRGLSMGVQIAVVHVLSAVVIVFLLDLAVRQFTGTAPADFRIIRLASYALIFGIGAVMLWHAISLLSLRRTTSRKTNAGCGHSHAEQPIVHAHSGCSACAAAASSKNGRWIAASVGIVPCTGALLVMLFGLANNIIWPAILMVVAISAGMALSMAAIGIIALYGRSIAEQRFAGRGRNEIGFDAGARIVGSACVLATGTLLFVLTLSYPPVVQQPVGELAQRNAESTFPLQ